MVTARKSEQYRLSNIDDWRWDNWERRLFCELLSQSSDDCRGCLSLLRAGGNLIAGHVGVRSRDVWHWWFPVYDTNYAQFSPGSLLLFEIVKLVASGEGECVIDLGKGAEAYRRRWSNAAIRLAEGAVTL